MSNSHINHPSFSERVLLAIRAMREAWELNQLTCDQIDSLARDAGISSHDLRDAVMAGDDAFKRYLSMMDQHGIQNDQRINMADPVMRDVVRVGQPPELTLTVTQKQKRGRIYPAPFLDKNFNKAASSRCRAIH